MMVLSSPGYRPWRSNFRGERTVVEWVHQLPLEPAMGTRANTLILIAPNANPDLKAPWIAEQSAAVTTDDRGTMIEFEANFTPTWARFGAPGEVRLNDLELELSMLRWLSSMGSQHWLLIREGEIEDIAGGWDGGAFAGDAEAGLMLKKNAEWIASCSVSSAT